MLLASALASVIRVGRLSVIDAAGKRHVFEGSPGPSATIRLHDPKLHWKILLKPRLYLPEAYMAGTLTVVVGSLYDLVDLLMAYEADRPATLMVCFGVAGGRQDLRIH